MSTTSPGNPLAAHVGENQFSPQAMYGDVEAQAALTDVAPISGAPTVPGQSASQGSAPAAPPPPAAAPAPTIPPAYYAQLAVTWDALAHLPGASPVVREMAKRAKGDSHKRVG